MIAQNQGVVERSKNLLSRRGFLKALVAAPLTLTQKLEIPQPKFRLGQRVVSKYFDDCENSSTYGQTFHSQGVVMGVCWNSDIWREDYYPTGWSYYLRVLESDLPGFVPDYEWITEPELIPL